MRTFYKGYDIYARLQAQEYSFILTGGKTGVWKTPEGTTFTLPEPDSDGLYPAELIDFFIANQWLPELKDLERISRVK